MMILIPFLTVPLALLFTLCLNLYSNWQHTIADQTRLEATGFSVCHHRRDYLDVNMNYWNHAINADRVAMGVTVGICDALSLTPYVAACIEILKGEDYAGQILEIGQNLDRYIFYRISEAIFENEISTMNKLKSKGIYESYSQVTSIVPDLNVEEAKAMIDDIKKIADTFKPKKESETAQPGSTEPTAEDLKKKADDLKKEKNKEEKERLEKDLKEAEEKQKRKNSSTKNLLDRAQALGNLLSRAYPDGLVRKEEHRPVLAANVKAFGAELPHILVVKNEEEFKKLNRFEFRYAPLRKLLGAGGNQPYEDDGHIETLLVGAFDTHSYQVQGPQAFSRTSVTCCVHGENDDESFFEKMHFSVKPESECPGEASLGRALSNMRNQAARLFDSPAVSPEEEDREIREEDEE